MNLTRQQVLDQKCPLHPNKNINLFYIGQKIREHRICHQCAKENKLQIEQLIEIQDILDFDCDSESQQHLFPVNLSADISQKIKQIANFDKKMMNEIKAYYKKLYSNIKYTLSIQLIKQQQKLDEILQMIKISDIEFLQKNQIREIQSILLSPQQLEASNSQLENCIQKFFQIEKQIEGNVNSLSELSNRFSTQLANNIQKGILSMMESIQFFNSPTTTSIKQAQIPSIDKQEILAFNSQPVRSILDTSTWQKSAFYFSSNQLQIIKNSSNHILIDSIGKDDCKSCYLKNELENNKKYRIIVRYFQPLLKRPLFAFGLLKSAIKDTESVISNSKIFFNLSTWNRNHTTTKIIKGENQSTNKQTQGEKRFEIRIDIKSQIWRIASLPNYENIQELDDPKRIELNGVYHFGVYLWHSREKITIEDVIEVESFDTLMGI